MKKRVFFKTAGAFVSITMLPSSVWVLSKNSKLRSFSLFPTKKYFAYLLSIVVAGILFACQPQAQKPNVIIFFTDDQGYSDVGCYGATGIETPNMDKLAENGIRFTNFYVPATVCTPSRAGILTGQYPKRSNLHEAVLFPYSTNGLPLEKYTLAELFKDNGYSTACIGKWHLGHLPEFMPNNQGFDYFYGVPYSNDMDGYYYKHNNFQSPPLPFYRNTELIEEGPDQRYLTKRYTEETINLIQRRGEKPFFIYLAHNMPHKPWYVSEKFDGKSAKGLYGDVIMELDWSMGEIIKTLKEEKIYDNTIVVFTSDNGPISNNSAKPLRGTKATTWEGGQRVPGIIAWPAKIPAHEVCNEMVTSMDLFPTFMEILHVDTPDKNKLDGMSILKLLEDPEKEKLPSRPFLYYSRNGQPEAIREDNWKLHIDKSLGWNHDSNDFSPALYNLDSDIGEQNNVIEDHPDLYSKMKNELIKTDETIK
ncbi:sulfatase [Maribellus sp. CM-23]|uniref:sulfatase family protein n=1 Tax=Maribellus sp. CM-23 TaxID=2781026 RepID=UPI001F1BE2CA|nr:sulfatase [Maribellus sp. CM-23]MCE4564801.1 sulfatase [Maribellus sp. CM-23]